ncbi:hypothetical protein [Flavobacterium sp.]|uniref:hypothetical protein n=1 Tax=Flavobacterium sp. TaxID=239 RepID=UPI00261CEAD6|nr:hypothetical protein [Flavobacterium sp.]
MKFLNNSIVVFFLVFNLTQAQSNYEFFGAIKLNGNDKTIITYRIVFEENNGIIKGYSISDLDGVHETKNTITGTYDRKTKQLSFQEKDILYTKSKFSQSSFCFVNFTGKVKLVEKVSKVEGNFKGLYKNKTKCIDGTVALVGSTKIYNLAGRVNKKIQKSKRIDQATKEKSNPLAILDSLKINKLSKDQNLSVFWESKNVKIQIYDAGKEDGDAINLYHNGKLILENYKVKLEKKTISMPLDLSIPNEFKITAVNEGTITPNTAKIVLYDDGRTFELLSSIKKNESAFITILKKE